MGIVDMTEGDHHPDSKYIWSPWDNSGPLGDSVGSVVPFEEDHEGCEGDQGDHGSRGPKLDPFVRRVAELRSRRLNREPR